MAAVVVAGAGLAFRIGLDEEAAEIGNRGVDLVGLGAPPCGDVRIERIGGRQAAGRLARGEIDRQPQDRKSVVSGTSVSVSVGLGGRRTLKNKHTPRLARKKANNT